MAEKENENKTSFAALRDDLSIQEGPRDLAGSPSWTIYDPVRNKFFKIGEVELALLQSWHMRDAEKILQATNQRLNHKGSVNDEQLTSFYQFLMSAELLNVAGAEHRLYLSNKDKARQKGVMAYLIQNYLFLRLPLVRPDNFLNRTWPLVRPLYTFSFLKYVFVIFLLGCYLIFRQFDEFTRTFQYFFTVEGMVLFAVTLVFIKIMHELGHAYACKYFGLKVPVMGVAFLVMWPVLYTDATDAWRLSSRWSRAKISAAGIMVELILASFAMVLWPFLPDGMLKSAAFFVATTAWLMSVAVNLNPLMRFDGYYFLSDVLNVPNLQERSFVTAKVWLRNQLFGIGLEDEEQWSSRLRSFIVFYAFAVWVYRFFLFLGIALLVYYLFFKALGIILFVIEIWWFIGKPIYNEVKNWGDYWPMMDSKYQKRMYVALGALVFVIFMPWRFSVNVPATLQAGEYQTFFTETPAQIAQVNLEDGGLVKKGDMLILFDSPELQSNIDRVSHDVRIYQGELDRKAISGEVAKDLVILHQELEKAYAELRIYQDQLDKLRISAPYDGRIRGLASGLRVGRWVNEDLPLFVLVNEDKSGQVIAYVSENYREDVRIEKAAWFYPENLDLPVVKVELDQVESTDSSVLYQPYLSSVYGGDIASSENDKGDLVTEESLYRVIGRVDLNEELSEKAIRGELKVPTGAISYGVIFLKKIFAVLIRESGF